VRVRHRAPAVAATLRPATDTEPARGGTWLIETDEPVWAAAPGQACVFEIGDVVLGGGRIMRAAPAAPDGTVRHPGGAVLVVGRG
jgi:tRNA U34 2-thiouridine synthase MnmA/TrmU